MDKQKEEELLKELENITNKEKSEELKELSLAPTSQVQQPQSQQSNIKVSFDDFFHRKKKLQSNDTQPTGKVYGVKESLGWIVASGTSGALLIALLVLSGLLR